MPGFTIADVHGIVTEISAASGWTAASKGSSALAKAMTNLLAAAEGAGGNAIVGLTSSTFGAQGGITNIVGGDAVGVLLMGTAVTVEPEGLSDLMRRLNDG